MLTKTPFISVAMRVCGLLLVIGLTVSAGLAQDKAQNKEKSQLDSSKQAPNASPPSVQPDIEISARSNYRASTEVEIIGDSSKVIQQATGTRR